MFIPELNRHIAVCSARELPAFVSREPNFWSSISIMEPSRKVCSTQGLEKVLSLRFGDEENLDTEESGIIFPKAYHIRKAIRFADGLPGEPLLIQCLMGQSRSAALALGLICRGYHYARVPNLTAKAASTLLEITPQARPNVLVLRLVLEVFLPPEKAEDLTTELVNDERLLANRFKTN